MMRWKASRRCRSSYLEGPQISSIGMADILVGIRIRSCTNTEYTSLIIKRNNCDSCNGYIPVLTLILPTWRIWWAPNNASRLQMGFNSAFKRVNPFIIQHALQQVHSLFQSEFSRECNLVLPLPNSNTFSFFFNLPVAVYIYFFVFPPGLSFPQ